MAAVDKMAAVWSAGIVAVGVALVVSLAGTGSTADDEPLAPSARCESGGHEWNEEFEFCRISWFSLCEDLGGKMVRGDPRAFTQDGTYAPIDVQVCKFADHETASGGESISPQALCESGGHEWNEEFEHCSMVYSSVCESLGGKFGCEPSDSLFPDSPLKLDVCSLVCEL